nr:PH, RCC1 and FYVE domains-containing protein 1-like [Ziziphus jujuba var. spinosa]
MLDEGGDKCHNGEGSQVRELPDMELSLRKVPCEVLNNSEVPVTVGSLSEVIYKLRCYESPSFHSSIDAAGFQTFSFQGFETDPTPLSVSTRHDTDTSPQLKSSSITGYKAITALKKGAYLLKYGRRGKPKFCPFRLSNDETTLIWYSGKDEKQLKLSHVSKIIPGQRTAIFQRYPRPEKEYQSFSLICNDRSLDLICKDKDEAEVWLVGLNALISRGNYSKWRNESRGDSSSFDSPRARTQRNSLSITPFDPGDAEGVNFENVPQSRWGKAFADIISYTAANKSSIQDESFSNSSVSPRSTDNSIGRNSASEAFRVSLSSAVSSSSQSSCLDDFDSLGDVFIWGEGIGSGALGGGVCRVGSSFYSNMDSFLPKALESTVVLDVHGIACGDRHALLVTKQGEIFSWGEETGGRLGHGVEVDVSQPKLIEFLNGMNIESVACGEYHSCAVTFSGDLYTWGDGTHYSGLLGHGSEVSHWIPKKISGDMEGLHVSYISCGLWHTAAVTSTGRLFTFGDGSFGALGHGDLSSTNIPREVEILSGLRTMRVACGVWHTAAVVEVTDELCSPDNSASSSSGKLFTWGDGDKGKLGHGDKESRHVPECVIALADRNICQVACGYYLTIALTTSGQVYTMGSTSYGQLGNPMADGKVPTQVEGKISENVVEEIACGSYHVAVLTSKTEVYTWGKGSNGQLGHGDHGNRNMPTLVDFLKDRQVKSVVCGSNLTAVICLHKSVSSVDHSICSGCRNPFGFRRKRHNCYNCGLVFCKACSTRKSLKAALAPNMNKPYRVCDDCYSKLRKAMENSSVSRNTKVRNGNVNHKINESVDNHKLQTTLSRLSSFGSVINQSESRLSNSENQPEAHYNLVFPALNVTSELGGFNSSKPSNAFVVPKKVIPTSVSGSRLFSRATSPVSGKSSPARSSGEIFEDSKYTSESLSQEIIILRAQVEDLTSKSKHLEAELEKTSNQLKEANAIAADEAEKCKSAKEVIKSLTAQLKEMSERLPEGHTISNAGSVVGCATNFQNQQASETDSPSARTLETGSIGNSINQIPNGTKTQTGKPEWVVQDEPGVYLTLSAIPGGGNELKRVRFSRRHFTEEQAEKWWAENGAKVCERHNILGDE